MLLHIYEMASTVFLPNPRLSDEMKVLKEPQLERLRLWYELRQRFLGEPMPESFAPEVESISMLKLKKYLIYTHRYLGVAFCVMFAVWFVSGVVMVYNRMPRLSAEERLMRLPVLDFSRATILPEQAFQLAGASGAPEKTRLTMFDDRPVYRFLS